MKVSPLKVVVQNQATFKFVIHVAQQVVLPGEWMSLGDRPRGNSKGEQIDRSRFYEWLWNYFMDAGLLGVHEGTWLTDPEEKEVLDSGKAPVDRDWVGQMEEACAELYFATHEEAERAISVLTKIPAVQVGSVVKQEAQDWDAEWKASFSGILVEPFWHIVPPWEADQEPPDQVLKKPQLESKVMIMNPGAGFGTGTHETTQLCLEALGELSQKIPLTECSALDFGSGSGILAIGMAKLGAQVDAVEIDSLAVDNARENAQLNGVENQIQFSESFPSLSRVVSQPGGKSSAHGPLYDLVVANILRPVLIEFADSLVSRLRPGGVLILSGLLESDLDSVVRTYSALLHFPPRRTQKGEWWAIVFDLSPAI